MIFRETHCFNLGDCMYLSIILGGCGFGLQPLNTFEYEEISLETEEKKEHESASSLENDSSAHLVQVDAWEIESFFSTADSFDKEDADGDGFSAEEGDCDDSDATINPENPDLARDGIDQDCDGFDSLEEPTSCLYSMRMLCGHDGWEGIWLEAKVGEDVLYKQPMSCNREEQTWSTASSEVFGLELAPGTELSLQLCSDNGCSSALRERYDIGLLVHAQETLIARDIYPEPRWSFTHICPQ